MVYPYGMYVNYRLTRDLIQNLLDTVAVTPDSIGRLMTLRELDTQWRRNVIPARDEATYEARKVYSSTDLSTLTGIDRHTLDYWVTQHRRRTGAPPLGRHRSKEPDLSRALNLRHGAVVSE